MKVESTIASQLYGRAKEVTASQNEANGAGFADALEKALGKMRATLEAGEKSAVAAMHGKGDTQSVVEALAAAEMALETAVVVRDKVVEAYQEILRMPV